MEIANVNYHNSNNHKPNNKHNNNDRSSSGRLKGGDIDSMLDRILDLYTNLWLKLICFAH